jgi:hypothetical protein
MTTPADELRTAAQALRPSSPAVAAHTVAVRITPAVAEAFADWLAETAEHHDASVVAARQVWGSEAEDEAHEWLTTGYGRVAPQALAVARAINAAASPAP